MASTPSPFDDLENSNASGNAELMFGGCGMGQGTMTGLAQLLAEELKVGWDKVTITVGRSMSGKFWIGSLKKPQMPASVSRLKKRPTTASTTRPTWTT